VVVSAPVAGPLPWLAPVISHALSMTRAHALLLHGAAGDGLFEAAQAITQAWLCESTVGPGGHACGRCGACRSLASGAHPDLHRLMPEELRLQLAPAGAAEADLGEGEGGSKARRKPSRQIRVDEVRAAIDWIVTTSSRGGAKVVLLHPAEAMNVQAANALLKTLEEPPQGARLLLTVSEPAQLLPTVRSRCQVVRLMPPDANQARAWLQSHGLAQAEVLLAACSNRPLDALEMASAGVDAQRWAALPAAVLARQAAAFSGWTAGRVLDALQKLCHDGLALAAGGKPRFFPQSSLQRPASLPALAAWSRALATLSRRIDHPWNEGLLVESLLLQARAAWTGASDRSDTLAS
jgi:DNA polymerase-3 subunit delta'